jgi:hypothetical protein
MKSLLLFSACVLIVSSLASARDLDIAGDKVTKKEIRHGRSGPRDTIIFYTFGNEAAVLQLNIKKQGGKFVLSGNMQLFAEGTNAEEIAIWINNQHSWCGDGGAPEPKASVALPADSCIVLESKIKDDEKISNKFSDKFDGYALKIKLADIEGKGFKLKGFIADASAFVEVPPQAPNQ